MEYQVNDMSPCKKRVQVTLEPTEVGQEFDRTYAQLRGQVVIPGFRPGKTPRRVLERRFGDHVKGEVTQELLEKNIEEVVKELELELVSPPSLVDEESIKDAIASGEGLTFAFEVETKAEFDLPEYKGVEVERVVPEVSDEDIQKVLDGKARDRATWQPMPEGSVWTSGDRVFASLTVKQGDEVIQEVEEMVFSDTEPQANEWTVLKPEVALKGARAGTTVEARVEKTDRSVEDVAHDASLEILEIKRQVTPEVDDEFATEMGHESLEDLRASVVKELEGHAQRAADEGVVHRILEKLVEEAAIPLAEGPTERVLEKRSQQAALQLMISGVKETDLQEKLTEEKARLRESIEFETRSWLIVEKIAKKEKIFALEDDVDEKVTEIAREHDTTPTRVREYYESNDLLPEIRAKILEQKVCTFLRDQAKVTESGTKSDEGAEADRDPPASSEQD